MSDFIVYSKTNCPQCVQAKNMITAAGKSYTERLFGVDLTREELMAEFPNVRSMPQIKTKDGTKLHSVQELQHFLTKYSE